MPELKTRSDIENRILELLLQIGVTLPALYQLQEKSFPEDEIRSILNVSGLPEKKLKLLTIAIESTLCLWREVVKQLPEVKNTDPNLEISGESPSGFTPHLHSNLQSYVDPSAETQLALSQQKPLILPKECFKNNYGHTKNLGKPKDKKIQKNNK